MKVSNELKILEIIKKNNGFVSFETAAENGISKTFFYRFIKKNHFLKVGDGLYFEDSFAFDEFFAFQSGYPKFVFSGMTALFLLGLTDKIPNELEVTGPYGYHPFKNTPSNCLIHIERNIDAFNYGNVIIKTPFGNNVMIFGKDKMVVELIKNRKEYDSETFLKALKLYAKGTDRNTDVLYEYSRIKNIEESVYDTMEILLNE